METTRVTYDSRIVKLESKFHVVVEQTKDYDKRMEYCPEQGVFRETEYRSLLWARDFPYPYGWLKESGTPPGDHLDCILISSKEYELGSTEVVRIIGCFRRQDGDHKLVCVPWERTELDLSELDQEEKEALFRLYPSVGEGEGWYGARKAREIVETFQNVGRRI
jgi:inorganic pyrophosphatase